MSEAHVEPFLVPDLGEGLTEATLTAWNVAVGDQIALNQPLCSLETAKAEVEIPSPYAGRVVELCGAVGDVLPVGSVLVRIETADQPAPRVLVGYGADDSLDAKLAERGILWAPDFVCNAGGIINIAVELEPSGYDAARADANVRAVADTLRTIFDSAASAGTTPLNAALELGRERLTTP